MCRSLNSGWHYGIYGLLYLWHYGIMAFMLFTALRHYGIYNLWLLITVTAQRAVTVIIILTATIITLKRLTGSRTKTEPELT